MAQQIFLYEKYICPTKEVFIMNKETIRLVLEIAVIVLKKVVK